MVEENGQDSHYIFWEVLEEFPGRVRWAIDGGFLPGSFSWFNATLLRNSFGNFFVNYLYLKVLEQLLQQIISEFLQKFVGKLFRQNAEMDEWQNIEGSKRQKDKMSKIEKKK